MPLRHWKFPVSMSGLSFYEGGYAFTMLSLYERFSQVQLVLLCNLMFHSFSVIDGTRFDVLYQEANRLYAMLGLEGMQMEEYVFSMIDKTFRALSSRG